MRLTIVAGALGFTVAGARAGGAQSVNPPSAEGAAQRAAQATAPVRPGRIIGVFDDRTGQPVAGAQVDDLLSGMSATTTATGTVSLFFVDTGGTLLRVRMVGYVPQTFPVKNSVRDTVPVTIVLKPAAQLLPKAVTTATSSRGPADTIRKLDLVGFYDRRNTTGAPTRAFVTEEQLRKVRLVSDLRMITGRRLCQDNLYIDGVLVTVPNLNMGGRRTNLLLKDGIDALIEPEHISAVELYRTADVPAQFNRTTVDGKPPCGATLIWTK